MAGSRGTEIAVLQTRHALDLGRRRPSTSVSHCHRGKEEMIDASAGATRSWTLHITLAPYLLGRSLRHTRVPAAPRHPALHLRGRSEACKQAMIAARMSCYNSTRREGDGRRGCDHRLRIGAGFDARL
ncbi:uncharacterized protein PSANT_00508 [Moesziomyces antarcticus]|uniref:Uncharacterized protein n=1 Tax=Pseudozyma antarctica TaxID=84753 RepID=A0A5C3FEH1_PSEA2|nr:uncharacterized protein PSANT_00508 [Moesziomyces antarcticus]